MRSRKPCLFTRFRFRGLYVGFITFGAYKAVEEVQWVALGMPRSVTKAAQQVCSKVRYPSVRAPVKVGRHRRGPGASRGKIDFSTFGI